MIQNYTTKSVHIRDQGLFVELALTLAKYFGRVTYTSEWAGAFPSSKDTEIGEGLAGVVRVDHLEEVKDETDLFIFPDTYLGDIQIDLVQQGKRVWGSRNGDELEIYRADAKSLFGKLSIPQGPYDVIKGIVSLRKFLKSKGEQKVWVKIEKTRADTETFWIKDYRVHKNKIDQLEYELGPKAEIMTFIVEDDLPGSIDLAIDTYCVDGQYPATAFLGTEEKNELYIGIRKKWSDCAPGLTSIYRSLEETLRSYEYRQFLSLESRARKNIINLGDPCCRFGSPPSDGQINWIANLPDIFWFGAEGKLIEPDIPKKYGAQLCLHSEWSQTHPLMIDFPLKYRDKIKLRYLSAFNDALWVLPHGSSRIGAIVTEGDSLEDAIEEAKEIAEQVNAIQIDPSDEKVNSLMEKIKQLQDWGYW